MADVFTVLAEDHQEVKNMLAELDKLRIKSDSLNKEIELLAQPVTKLSSEELSLLRVGVSDLADDFARRFDEPQLHGRRAAPRRGDPQSLSEAGVRAGPAGGDEGP